MSSHTPVPTPCTLLWTVFPLQVVSHQLFLPQKWEKEEVCVLPTALPEVFHSPDTQITSLLY